MSSSRTRLISGQSGLIRASHAPSISSASRSRVPARSSSILSISGAPGFFNSSRERISSVRTVSSGVLRTRAISVANFARDAFGGGVRKSGVNPTRGCTAFNPRRPSCAADSRCAAIQSPYNGRCFDPFSTRTADIVSHNGDAPNRHRSASAWVKRSTVIENFRPQPKLYAASPEPVHARRVRTYRAVLSLPGLRAVYAAHTVSMLGTVAAQVALSILIFERTGSPLLSALVLACSFLPYAVSGVLFSSIADRFPARRVLVACDVVSAAAIGLMLIPGMPVGGLLGLLVVTGFVAPVFAGARAASLAHLLPADLFPVGRSLLRAISQVAVLTGFALGGIVVAVVGANWLLALDAVTFIASAVLIATGTPYTPPGERKSNTVRDSWTGLQFLFANAKLRNLILLTWVAPAFSSVPDGLAVAYTAQVGTAAAAAGALFTGYAVGSVLGELVVARFTPSARRRLVVPFLLLSQLPAIAFLTTPPIPVAAVLLAISGSGYAFNQAIDPLILQHADPSYRGRLFTVQTSGLMAIQGVSIALGGVVGSFLAPNLTMAAAGILGTTTTLLIARQALTTGPRRSVTPVL
ncbi:MFS transporter [Kribbella speibonae]|uniref:MFS transporter n=1 Tax=Kribbella speibonae TaxID=1572660 RepID=A0A4R0IXL0_9ACTN|nr:MFS transporter [Kribbella speibonae]